MKATINKFVAIVLVSVVLSLLVGVSGATWIIEGDTVCTNNETWGELCVSPHTLHGPRYAYCNATMAEDYGNIDFVWGFNTSLERPRSIDYYNPHWENLTSSQFLQNVSNIVVSEDACEVGHEYNIIKRNITYDHCSEWNETTMECEGYEQVTQVVCFDTYQQEGDNYTITWHTARMKYWQDITNRIDSVNYNWNSMNKWYYIDNISMPAGVTKTVRVWIDMPVAFGSGENTKFFFAAKRTTDTIQEAIAADRFMFLDPWHNASRSSRKLINVTHVNASGSDLVNYTVFLNVSKETEMQSDFDDILFYETGGTAMSFEYENHTANYGLFWVLVPSLTAASDTQFWMYYGNDVASSSSDPESSWNVNCSMVQHLQEAPANDTAGHLDSTSNDNDGTPKNFNGTSTSTTDGTGKIDGADVFDGSDDYVDCGTGISLAPPHISIAVWVYPKTITGTHAIVVRNNAGNRGHAIMQDSTSKLNVELAYTADNYISYDIANVFLSTNEWYHIVLTTDGSHARTYKDGELIDTHDFNHTLYASTDETYIGVHYWSGNPYYYFNGLIDEVRVCNRALSADEINQSYQLVSNQSTYVVWDSAEQKGTPPVISNVINCTISSTSHYIDWDVNQTAYNRVKWSNESDLTPAYYSSWQNSTNAPNITLSGLTASTQYWYQVWSYNTTNTSLNDNSSTLSFTTTSSAVWCDSDHAKRINVSVNNTAGSALTDYQVYVNLSSNPINETSLRVYNSTSCTLRPHWTENETGGNSYGVWINYSAIAASAWTNNTAIYYDNVAASSASNGTATFITFDDFEPSTTTVSWGIVKENIVACGNGWYEPSHPLGIYVESLNKTFLTWINKTVTGGREIPMVIYNHTSGEFEDETQVATYPENDGHGSPAITIDDDGYIYNFYRSHHDASPQQYKKSTNPYDVTAWGAEQTISGSMTYPHPFCIDNNVYVTFRKGSGVDSDLYLYNLTGTTWTKLADFGNTDATSSGYHRTNLNRTDNTTHVAWVQGHNNPRNVYYMHTDDITNNSAWKKADGTLLALPVGETDPDKIYTGTNTWLWGLELDNLGNPCILFTSSVDDKVKFTRWNGTAWNIYNVTDFTHASWITHGALKVDNTTHMRVVMANNSGNTADLWKTSNSGVTWAFNKTVGEDIGITYKANSYQTVYNANSELEFLFGPVGTAAVWGAGKDWSHQESGGSTTIFTTTNGVVDYANTVQKYGGVRSMKLDGQNAPRAITEITLMPGDSKAIRFRCRVNAFDATAWYPALHGDSTQTIYTKIVANGRLNYNDGSWQDSGFDFTANTWQLVEVKNMDWTNHKYDMFIDGVKRLDQVGCNPTASYNNKYEFEGIAADAKDVWIDDFIVRKYIATEPSATLGNEEQQGANPTLHIDNAINIKEDWGIDFNSNLSANVTTANASNVWMNFTNAEFTNTSLGNLNLSLDEWVNESHNVNAPLANVSITVYLTSPTSRATNDTDSFWYEVTKRTNTATMDSAATQSVDTSESFYVNATCNEEYGDTFLGAANLLEDGAIIDTDTSVTNYVNFSHSESSAGVYNYTIRFYNLTHYNNATTLTYSNVTVSDVMYEPPNPTNLQNVSGNFWVNHTWSAGTPGNVTDSFNVSVFPGWYNTTTNTYYNDSGLTPHDWSNVTVYAYNSSGNGSLSVGSVSDDVQIPNNLITVTVTENYNKLETQTVFISDTSSSDTDGDTPTYSCNRTDLFIDFSTVTGYGNWTTGTSDAGIYYVDIGVSDGWGSTNNKTLTITIEDATPGTPSGLANTTGNFWVNYTWSGGVNTDSYNVSWNLTWYNGTTNTFMKKEVGCNNWANITVYAFNSSGSGSLSAGSVSDSVHISDFYVPPNPSSDLTTKGNFWVNHTWGAPVHASNNDTDSHNYSVNSTWYNGSFTLSHNNTGLPPHGWSNITIWAYNDSCNGSLSRENLSDDVQLFNNVPVLNGLPDNTTDEDVNQTDIFDLDAYFTDTDGDTPTFLVESNNQSAYVTVTINISNNVSYTLASGWNGTASVVINATDSWGGEDNDTFLIIVNAAPLPGDYIPGDPTTLQNTTGNYWVNYTWNVGGGNATDSYNVSWNLSWYNTTTDTFMKKEVGASNWANITVYAYNSSGNGSLSAGSVSDNVQAPAFVPGDYIPPDPTTLQNTTGNYYVNYTWVMGVPGNITDSYNVSWNLSWFNGTLTTYMQKEVGASNWGNITIYAYNSSGNGTLSTGSVSDNVQAPTYTSGDYPPATPTTLANTTGNGWVHYTWSSGGGANITDSYNVSWNLTWYNTTLVSYMNDTVGEFGWANITVFAFNSSGNGSLSAGSISDETQADGGTYITSMGTTAYNLITYYGSSASTAEQFGLDIGSVDYIAMYNGSFWSHTMGFSANNFTVYHGIGYYVYLNASGSSTYQRNNIPDSPYNTQLFNRWNTIGWTNSTNTNAEGIATSIGSACKYTSMLNADGVTYTTHTVGFSSNNHAVEKGKGYWVWTNAGLSWSRNS